jgi:MFS family permease
MLQIFTDSIEPSETLITGIVLSVFGFLNSFGQPFAGRLSDRTGKRTVFIQLS